MAHLAQAVAHRVRSRRRVEALDQFNEISWRAIGAGMTSELDRLRETAGSGRARHLVCRVLDRIDRQLSRLQAGARSSEANAAEQAGDALRECGALIGNGRLMRVASELAERAACGAAGVAPLRRSAIAEARRSLSWLRIWRAVNTPAPTLPLTFEASSAFASDARHPS